MTVYASDLAYSPPLVLISAYHADMVLAGSAYSPCSITHHNLPAWADGLAYSPILSFRPITIALNAVPGNLTITGQSISMLQAVVTLCTVVSGTLSLTGHSVGAITSHRFWNLLGEGPIIDTLSGDSL